MAKKLAKQEEFKAAKKKKQPRHDSSTKRKDMDTDKAEKESTDSKKMNLELAESIVDGLTTHMIISANNAHTFVDHQLAEFNAAN